MSIQDDMKIVDKIMMRPRPEQSLPELFEQARGMALANNTRYGWSKCGTQYTEDNHEILVWQLTLMCSRYLAGLLALKAAEGHCQTQSHVPCNEMANAHLYLFGEYKKALQQVVSEMEQLELTVRDKTENLTKLGKQIAKDLGLRDD